MEIPSAKTNRSRATSRLLNAIPRARARAYEKLFAVRDYLRPRVFLNNV